MTRQWILVALLALLLVNSEGCARGLNIRTVTFPWEDGRYIGVNDTLPTTPFIQVAVDITWGRMVAISLLQHPVWKAPTETAGLVDLVLASQTTAGHIPRGTGSEHEQLLQAIDNALMKARSSTPTVP
jgi:uncharacterized protein with FMN-binding domain